MVDSADALLATAAPEIRRILEYALPPPRSIDRSLAHSLYNCIFRPSEEYLLSATNENAVLLLVHKHDPNSPWRRYIGTTGAIMQDTQGVK